MPTLDAPSPVIRDGVRPLGLYLHFPFCVQRCPYCDFATVPWDPSASRRYTAALVREVECLALLLSDIGYVVTTAYLGGGTPSVTPGAELACVVSAARAGFRFGEHIEMTLEADPATFAPEAATFEAWRALGVTRISLGVQSFRDDILARLGRTHTARQAREACVATIAAAWDVNVDLIFGAPGQTMDDWRADLAEVIDLHPAHVSVYGLTIEERTVFGHQARVGRLVLPSQDVQARMFLEAHVRLGAAGYEHYEVSNYALAGKRARHNVVCWKRGDYLGLGLGAHSHLTDGAVPRVSSAAPTGARAVRLANTRAFREYMRRVETAGRAVVLEEAPEGDAALAETLLLALRTADGFDLGGLQAEFGPEIRARVEASAGSLVTEGLLHRRGQRLSPTVRGMLLHDAIVLHLLPGGPSVPPGIV